MKRLLPRQMQRFLLDPETQTFLLDRRTAAARPMIFALASNSGLSAVWLKSGRRALGAIRERIDARWSDALSFFLTQIVELHERHAHAAERPHDHVALLCWASSRTAGRIRPR